MTKPDLMAELAACPFCGGRPTSTEDEDEHVFVVGCLDCGYDLYSGPVGVGWFKSLPDAIAAWNKRTHHAEPEAVVRDAAIGRAYLRWYAAAEGYRNVIADAAHEAIMEEAMHNSAREG